jgi:RES domain-containing protein
MRVLYRVATAKRANDLSGEGARLAGGRWNSKNTAVIYTSESRSLAAMEYLVHTPLTNIPDNLKIISIGIPDSVSVKQVDLSALPRGWNLTPSPFALADMGTTWVARGESLLLRVPSAVIAHEFNIIISPKHPDMKRVEILSIEDFIYDERLHQRRS